MKSTYLLTILLSATTGTVFCVESTNQLTQSVHQIFEIRRPVMPTTHEGFLERINFFIRLKSFMVARRNFERWLTLCEKNLESPKVNAYLEDIERINSKLQSHARNGGYSAPPVYVDLNNRVTNIKELSRLHVVC